MNRRLFTVLSACVLLASCGSPADNIAFKAPPNWSGTPGIMGRFQIWTNSGQVVMLFRGDKNTSLQDATKSAPNVNGSESNLSSKPVTLCGTQQGQYFSGTGHHTTNGKDERTILEGTYTRIGDSSYFAMYIRPATAKPDGAAEGAIHSLCPK